MGLGISSVGIPEISPYTKSEQPRIAGKHLTRHAKNGYAVVGNIATLRSRASIFFEGQRPLPRSLDILYYVAYYRYGFNRKPLFWEFCLSSHDFKAFLLILNICFSSFQLFFKI